MMMKNRMLSYGFAIVAILSVCKQSIAAVDLAQIPLYLGGVVEPNIMFVLDDSGSMHYEIMPDEHRGNGLYTRYMFPRGSQIYGSSDYTNYVPTFVDNQKYNAFSRSKQGNPLYYDPSITYLPWPRADGAGLMDNADPEQAYHNPMRTARGFRNLTQDNTQSARWVSCTSVDVGTVSGCTFTDNISRTFWPATYFWHTGDTLDDWGNYDKIEIRSTTPNYSGHGRENRTDCAAGVCTYAQEIQNFANWYQYYRSRILASRGGISRAFAQQSDGMRVGYGAINKGSSTIDGRANTSTIVRGVRKFAGSTREEFFDLLYDRDIPASGTPLRNALKSVGDYYSWADNRGPWGKEPGSNNTEAHLTCRGSYTILMTDGYWNGDSPSVGNSDNTPGNEITAPDGTTFQYQPTAPYRDEYSNTLADVAMHYWKNDLRTGLDNQVPVHPKNEAFWQHMVTFGVGLGVVGSIDPEDAWQAVAEGSEVAWPEPTTNPGKIDDLLHAGINSRGGFFSARDPITFSNELSGVLSSILARTDSSAASIATNSTRLDADTFVYQAKYDSRNWIGQLLAFSIDQNDGSVSDVASWDAGAGIPNHGSRKIFTFNGSEGVEFTAGNFGSLNLEQQGSLGSEPVNMINYLRGDKSLELRNGGVYRNRTRSILDDNGDVISVVDWLLGDIVNSDPWYVGFSNFGYGILPGLEGEEYVSFLHSFYVDGKPERAPVLYVGANDGMLHAFHAETGEELFGYIPNAVYHNLASLADPGYEHKYFVDGAPRAGDVYVDIGNDGPEWRTILVGSVGAGGRGVFALDVTDIDGPDSFSASNVLWEFGYSDDPCVEGTSTSCREVGEGIGQPSIVRLSNGQWGVVFGSGYNSYSNTASLFIVNAETGVLIRRIRTVSTNQESAGTTPPNGMATPIVVDLNGDRIADRAYVGDLLGNLWRFDIDNTTASNWDSPWTQGGGDNEYPHPLFVAMDSSNNRQPITSKPQMGRVKDGGHMIFFGTGKYLSSSDTIITATNQVQSLYGIIDTDARITTARTTALAQQSIILEQSDTFTDADGNSHDWDIRIVTQNPTGARGWFLDLLPPSPTLEQRGERIVSSPLLWRDRVIFTTMIPDPDPCSYGGTSWLMELDPLSGGRLNFSVFDLNRDGRFDGGEYVQIGTDAEGKPIKVPVSGVRSKEGIIKTPGVISAAGVAYKYTSGSTGVIEVIENRGEAGRGRQSWTQLR